MIEKQITHSKTPCPHYLNIKDDSQLTLIGTLKMAIGLPPQEPMAKASLYKMLAPLKLKH